MNAEELLRMALGQVDESASVERIRMRDGECEVEVYVARSGQGPVAVEADDAEEPPHIVALADVARRLREVGS